MFDYEMYFPRQEECKCFTNKICIHFFSAQCFSTVFQTASAFKIKLNLLLKLAKDEKNGTV